MEHVLEISLLSAGVAKRSAQVAFVTIGRRLMAWLATRSHALCSLRRVTWNVLLPSSLLSFGIIERSSRSGLRVDGGRLMEWHATRSQTLCNGAG